MKILKKAIITLFLIPCTFIAADAQNTSHSAEIYEAIRKLNFLGSALYVGAHPDDENTALISYLANGERAQTAYMSLTRGDGGQNLIGSELRELLGVIRTQELLQARNVDGGRQYFSRANDFGFSKLPDETFNFWEKEKVLHDLVYVIRKFQPDVIINRFDHRTPGATHGHHTASAMLSVEAFALAGDSTKFTAQLGEASLWQPKRLFFNDSWFLYPSQDAFEKADHRHKLKVHTGAYYPGKGQSNGEIAAKSRSQHSSQGFGAAASRGDAVEYLEIIAGDMPKEDIFEGIDTSWERIPGGKEIGDILHKVEENYDFKNPAASVPDLLNAYRLIQNLNNAYWRDIKENEIKKIIADALGLYLEATVASPYGVRNEEVKVKLKAINRSPVSVRLSQVSIGVEHFTENISLEENKMTVLDKTYTLPAHTPYSSPYWLEELHTTGMYSVSDKKLIGQPERSGTLLAKFDLNIDGISLSLEKPLQYSYVNPAKGEIYQPFALLPKASLQFEEKVVIYPSASAQKITVKVEAHTAGIEGSLRLHAPQDWQISPTEQKVSLERKGETKVFYFDVKAPDHPSEIDLQAELKTGKNTYDRQLSRIEYEHIPTQYVLLPAEAKHVRIDIEKKGDKIAYIHGAGDVVPDNLRQIGYKVDIISPENVSQEALAAYDAVILGVRAFNVLPELKYKNRELFDYVKNGGNLIVQYNVSRGQLVTEEVAPFPLQISLDRVTDEDSKVEFLDKEHPALNYPNAITEKDFENWVQERGLYFPDTWDALFTPLLSMHDKGEDSKEGSLLVAKYGKGYYVYTGLSFFRELPAGVSGAYRLMANLISLGKNENTK